MSNISPPKGVTPNTPAAIAGAQAVAPAKPPFVIHELGSYSRWIKMIAYGDYGVGKTRLVASAVLVPQMRDVLFIDCEAGDLTVATEAEADFQKYAHENFNVVRVNTFQQLARVQEFLKLHCTLAEQGNEEKLKELERRLMPEELFDAEAPAKRYRTVIIDSLTEAEAFSMYQLLGISDRTKLDDDVASPEWAEYKRNHSQILRMVRAFRDLPMNVLMTAAAGYIQDENKRMIWMPALTGRLAKQVQGFMDIIGYMYVQPGENNVRQHILQVMPTPKINAKCRFSNFKGQGWTNPTMKSILESVNLLEKVGK